MKAAAPFNPRHAWFPVLLYLVLFTVAPRPAWADAIVRTQAMRATNIAEFFIDERGVRVELEIGLADLQAFANLVPDAVHERLTGESQPLQERLPQFFGEDLAVIADSGEPLPGYVVSIGPRDRVVRDEISGQPIPSDPETAETVIFAELVYPFPARPDSVSLINGRSVSIGFVVYHEGVAVNDFRYLTPEQTLDLDWADPWYSAFTNRALRRTYFAPMSAFIYVEPYEVRKEVIVRPKDLQQWVDLGLAGRDSIPVELQGELKQRVGEFLRTRQTVTIDGAPAAGELARINFLDRTLTSSNVIDPPRELDLNVATLGVIFVYPTVEPLPQNVQLDWDLFTDKMQVVPGATVDQAGSLPTFLEPDFHVLEWQNFLRFPELPTLRQVREPPGLLGRTLVWLRWLLAAAAVGVLGWVALTWRSAAESRRRRLAMAMAVLLVAGAGLWLGERARLTDARAERLVTDLLHNIYRAFDFRAEGDIYDVLAQSVTGDLLTDVYLETRRGLVLESQGGARAKVKDIELVELSTEPSDAGGFVASAAWVVRGSVGHWGHLHQRANRYQAELDIRPVDGAWKLLGMQILQEERL